MILYYIEYCITTLHANNDIFMCISTAVVCYTFLSWISEIQPQFVVVFVQEYREIEKKSLPYSFFTFQIDVQVYNQRQETLDLRYLCYYVTI
jgi:hypothetical protein